MSINTLIEDVKSKNKPWCNIYVNTMTSYKNSNVQGNLKVDHNISSESINTGSLTINNGQAIDVSSCIEKKVDVMCNERIIETSKCIFSRLGRQVTIQLSQFKHTEIVTKFFGLYETTTPVQEFTLKTIDQLFCPSQELNFLIPVISHGKQQIGLLQIYPDGIMKIYAGPNKEPFNCGGQISSTSVTFIV